MISRNARIAMSSWQLASHAGGGEVEPPLLHAANARATTPRARPLLPDLISKSSFDADARDGHGTDLLFLTTLKRATRADRLFAQRHVHPLRNERDPPFPRELPALLEAQIEPKERRQPARIRIRGVGSFREAGVGRDARTGAPSASEIVCDGRIHDVRAIERRDEHRVVGGAR